jgi:hypothetical protein
MIPKSAKRFSEKIMLKQMDRAERRLEESHPALGPALRLAKKPDLKYVSDPA